MPSPKKKTKIVATIGPATNSPEMILRLARAGVNIFRINLSHQEVKTAKNIAKMVLKTEVIVGRPLGILVDLAGPKIRISQLQNERLLRPGDTLTIGVQTSKKNGDAISLNYESVLKNIRAGTNIFLGDGASILKVIRKTNKGVITKVVVGGMLRSHMAFTPQGIVLRNQHITNRDKKAVVLLAQAGITALAVSFVQKAEDIKMIRHFIPKNVHPMIFAKIETLAALENIEAIIDEADGVLIARGDLGLSIPMEQIPTLQKKIINLALHKAKPVITATQMLESMTYNPLPTRAEVADVAHAILDGTDAIMLSGETAVGRYPEKVIQMARAVIEEIEPTVKQRDFTENEEIAEAVSAAVVRMAKQVHAKLILVLTETGKTARRISRHRSLVPILALTQNPGTARGLNFSWGIYPRLEKDTEVHNFNELIQEAQKIAKKNRILNLRRGDTFIICAGVPFRKSGTTNLVLVEIVK